MNCPICGRELWGNARKCDNCGCRPKYLYGRPKPPKWVWFTAAALAVAILIGSLLFTLPGRRNTRWEAYFCKSISNASGNIEYTYDEKGNLLEVSSRFLASSVMPLRLRMEYDENGVFTGFSDSAEGSSSGISGTVTYDEENRSATVSGNLITGSKITFVFQFDSDDRLSQYEWGSDTVLYTVLLDYDENGRLISYNHSFTTPYLPDVSLTDYRQETLQYAADGALNGWEIRNVSSATVQKLHCYTDETGNVTEIRSVDGGIAINHTYEKYTVSDRTVRQYILQRHLLYNILSGPIQFIYPIIKTPA
ncbi:MAG: hypothetical protein E7462_02450 [Ruminococcaceae bacterium]|nr:hypothetical protein [Oscillospiraceae bacterium]